MIREIILDTETTGFEPREGHRIIEIGCLEVINCLPTGRVFQTYINPERDVPTEAFKVHGLTTDFLKPFPVFAKVVSDFFSFIGNDQLVIHNAPFDLKFLNAELARLSYPLLPAHRAIDTLKMAQTQFPGSPVTLDALCRRFGIALSERKTHGALVDCKLLAAVYMELSGGRQGAFEFENKRKTGTGILRKGDSRTLSRRPPRPHYASEEELKAHQTLVSTLKNNLW